MLRPTRRRARAAGLKSYKRQCSEGREAGAGTDRAAGAARAAREGFWEPKKKLKA